MTTGLFQITVKRRLEKNDRTLVFEVDHRV